MTVLQAAPAGALAVLDPPSPPVPAAGVLRRWSRIALPLVVVKLLGQGLEFAGWVLLARDHGASRFGELTVAFLVCRYAGIVADWGASLQGVRDVAAGGARAELAALVRRRAQVATGLAAVYVVAVVGLGRVDLLPLAAVLLARGLGRDWVALGRGRPLRAGVPLAVQGAVLALGAWLVDAPAAVLVGVAYCCGTLVSLLLNRLDPAPRARAASVPGWTMLALVADQVVASGDALLLAWVHGPAVAGVYAAVYRLPNACLAVVGLLAVGLVPVVVAQLTEGRSPLPALRRRLLRASAAGALVVLALAPLAWLLVPALLGPQYLSGRAPLAVLFVAIAVTTLAAPLHPLYVVVRSPRAYAGLQGAAAAVVLAADAVLLRPLGMTGAAIATLTAQLAVLGLLLRGTRAVHDPGSPVAGPAPQHL